MATKIVVHLRSGKTKEHPLEDDALQMQPHECAKAFYDSTDLVASEVLWLGDAIFFVRDIEAFTFE